MQRAERAEAEIQRLVQNMPGRNAAEMRSNVQPVVTVSMSHDEGGREAVHVEVAGSHVSTIMPADPSSPGAHSSLQSMVQTEQRHGDHASRWQSTIPPQTLQKGIDFVLALEKPCFNHMIQMPESSSGHALTVHAALMTYTSLADDDGPLSYQVPAVVIENLLQLSYSLPLMGEVTPVQAWQRLSSRSSFNNCDAQRLQDFQAAILPAVRCHGFGAVIEEADFERLSSSFFPIC